MIACEQDIAALNEIFEQVAADMRDIYSRNPAFSVDVARKDLAVVMRIKKVAEGLPENYHHIAHDSEIRAELREGHILLNAVFGRTAENIDGTQYFERGALTLPWCVSLPYLGERLSGAINSPEIGHLMNTNTALIERRALECIAIALKK